MLLNFFFYQLERAKRNKTHICFYLPESDMYELEIYLEQEFVYLARAIYIHPELKIRIFLKKDGLVTLIPGE